MPHRFSPRSTRAVKGTKNGVAKNPRGFGLSPRGPKTELQAALEMSLASARAEERDERLVAALVEMGYEEEHALGCLA